MVRGTPTWSIDRLGSGVITARAEKSTRFPIKFPLTRPSLLFSLCFTDLSGRPDFCMAYSKSRKHKCNSHCYLTHSCQNPYPKNNSKIYNNNNVPLGYLNSTTAFRPMLIEDKCPINKNDEKISLPTTFNQRIFRIKNRMSRFGKIKTKE